MQRLIYAMGLVATVTFLALTSFLIAAPSASAQGVVRCHSGGRGTIEECRERDAEARSRGRNPQGGSVQCHSGGRGTIEECRERDAEARSRGRGQQGGSVQCHSGGRGTIEECRERDAQSNNIRCRSGGRGSIEECRARDRQARGGASQSDARHEDREDRSRRENTDERVSNGSVLPTGPGRISAGYFDPSYARSQGRQHLGVDTLARTGSSVTSPIRGEVIANRTNVDDVNAAYLVIRASNGEEHVFGHISSSLRRGDRVRVGQEIGRIRSWPGEPGRSHLHWGVNSNGIEQAMSGGWGWGRAPVSATRRQASNRGWRNP